MQSLSKPLVIVKAGSSRSSDDSLLKPKKGDFEEWIAHGTGHSLSNFLILEAYHSPEFPEPEDCAGVIITGSHSYVTAKAAWSENLASWITRLLDARTPLLGICFGHQIIAHAAGGMVGFNPMGINIGSIDIHREAQGLDDPLLGDLPPTFQSYVAHLQGVLKAPDSAVVLVSDDKGSIQAMRIGDHAWGLQFHPEFNRTIMNAYIDWQHGAVADSGQNGEEVKSRVVECERARALLARFVEMALGGVKKVGSDELFYGT